MYQSSKEKGYQLVLATMLFSQEATLARIEWAGLNKNDFVLITTYEDFHYAKPNLGYLNRSRPHRTERNRLHDGRE